jgi:maltooligosyltrehalose trehalohydrolase
MSIPKNKNNVRRKIGVQIVNNEFEFTVWAPFLKAVDLVIVSEQESIFPMKKDECGYWSMVVDNVKSGTRYFYRLNNTIKKADPSSMFQPEGVHGPSCVVNHNEFEWTDHSWQGIPLNEMIIYEIHVGTFTPQGSLEAVISKLDYLKRLGITAIELMPFAQFPGERNWGYDGTYPFSVQNSYGGPIGLKKLVNASHEQGLAVILDVVYNHLGPEGNYFAEFGPYFTDKYKTPWGNAINFDDVYSSEVRNYFIQNTLYWFDKYHIDALRLDAIHEIYDIGARHILDELAEDVEGFSQEKKRKFYLIAESNLNDARILRKREYGGYSIDAQWSDDFHHCVHTLLTGEKDGYYQDFGTPQDFMKALKETFVYSWRYSSYRKKFHGNCAKDIDASQFIVSIQNHDQVGNRMKGERLSNLVSFEALKLAAAVLFSSPYIPLLFMGEEYAENNPFLYFVSHSDDSLIEAVREGRKKEFQSFSWREDPPDPQSEDTFYKSKLGWEKLNEDKHNVMLNFYRQLIATRKETQALKNLDKRNLTTWNKNKLIILERWNEDDTVICLMNFSSEVEYFTPHSLKTMMKKIIDTSDRQWLGTGSKAPEEIQNNQEVIVLPYSFIMYRRV